MVLRHHQHRDAERVGQEDELLPLVVALVAGGGQELDAAQPFGLAQLRLANEGVQVPYQRAQDLLQARVVAAFEAGEDRVRDVVFVDVSHGRSESSGACKSTGTRRRVGCGASSPGFQSGWRLSSIVGISSLTVGWMCTASRMTLYDAPAAMTSRIEWTTSSPSMQSIAAPR